MSRTLSPGDVALMGTPDGCVFEVRLLHCIATHKIRLWAVELTTGLGNVLWVREERLL